MKNVIVGGLYAVKISGKVVPVRISGKIKSDGVQRYRGVNLATGKSVSTVTAGKCRCKLPG